MRNSPNVYLVLKISHQLNSPSWYQKLLLLKRKSNDKKEEIWELEGQIKVLEIKQENVNCIDIKGDWKKAEILKFVTFFFIF